VAFFKENPDMNLLLGNPAAHKALDDWLFQFLQSLHSSQSYPLCAAEARRITESCTGQQPGTYCLFRPTWEDDWQRNRRVDPRWFYHIRKATYVVEGEEREGIIEDNEDSNEALYTVGTKLVPFVLAQAPYSQQKYRKELEDALSEYLEPLGYPVTKHPDGPEDGRWLWWDGEHYPIPEGQAYRIVDFMWHRETASFYHLIRKTFKSSGSNEAVSTAVNRVNNALRGIPGFPWKLTTSGVNRMIKKIERNP
jgi:hypothetical protein